MTAAHHLGWLHATPKDWKMTRGEAIAKGEASGPGPMTVVEGEYLMEAFGALGCSHIAGMGGEVPIPWSEIHAYACVTGTLTEPWEVELVREMSSAYCRGKVEGGNVFSIPPAERQSSG